MCDISIDKTLLNREKPAYIANSTNSMTGIPFKINFYTEVLIDQDCWLKALDKILT